MRHYARTGNGRRGDGQMSYIDVHAHFAEEGYDFPAEWEKILRAGVKRVILAGDNLEHSVWHAAFCAAHGGAYFAAGVHPSETADFSLETEREIRTLLTRRECVAVGEIGLDYHYPDSDKRAQRAAFERQLELAYSASLPVEIHSRDACRDTLDILKNAAAQCKNGILLHCYSYGRENMDAFLSLGAYFSFGGVTCFKNAKSVWESVEACPETRILSETDSPYLSPVRGEKNTPANIPLIVGRISELKGREMQAQIEENAERLFTRLKS